MRAAKTRLIALGWYLQLPAFRHANVTKLAGDFGLTSAGISKYIRALNRHFGVYAAGQKQSMRRRDRTKTKGHTPSSLKGIGDPGLN